MKSRVLRLSPGDVQIITADEVRDPVLRENLQVRAISIVRPTTDEEEDEVVRMLEARAAQDEMEEAGEESEEKEGT